MKMQKVYKMQSRARPWISLEKIGSVSLQQRRGNDNSWTYRKRSESEPNKLNDAPICLLTA